MSGVSPNRPTSDGVDAEAKTHTRGQNTPERVEASRGLGALTSAGAIGRFRILHPIGEGGMGAVYAAYDPKLDRRVAVKVLRGIEDGTGIQRLLREAQALARLQHPNVVAVHDAGIASGRVFIAMEFVQGQDLKAWVQAHPAGGAGRFREVMGLLLGAGRGLAAAHSAGLVHRDVKPHNILCGLDGRARMVDFGLARGEASGAVEHGTDPIVDSASVSVDERLTRTGAVMGTPAYMAPEQLRGDELDARADIFAFCVTAWEAIFGARPFTASSSGDLLSAIKQGRIRDPPAVEAEAWAASTLRRGLAAQPSARYARLDELLRAWESRLSPDAARPRLLRWVLGAAVVGIAVPGFFGVRELDRRARARECEELGAAVRESWPGRADSVGAGLSATGLPFADTTSQKLAPWLDAWSQSWQRARGEVCTRATIDDTLDSKQETHARTCLDLQRAQVDGLLDPLEASDPRMINGAVERAASLPDPASCLDASRLSAAVWPEDARYEQVLEIRRRSLVLPAAIEAGDRSAVATARSLLHEARGLGFEPLQAEAQLTLGTALMDGEHEEAEATLRAAYFEALRLDLPAVAAEAALRLETTIVFRGGRPDDGLEWAQHAQMWIERLGEGEGLLGARLANVRGVSHRARGEYADELRQYERALALYEAILGPDHPEVAESLHNISTVLARTGEYDTALQRLDRASTILSVALGDEHPRTWECWATTANVRIRQGKLDEAAQIHERVLRLTEAAYGPENLRVASALSDLAVVYAKLSDHDRAIAMQERVLKIRVAVFGPDHPDVADTLSNLAAHESAAGRYEEALPIAQRALKVKEASFGLDHPIVAHELHNLGSTMLYLSRPAEAVVLLERETAIREQVSGESPLALTKALGLLGWAYQDVGRLDEAERSLRRAVSVLIDAVGENHFGVAEMYEKLAGIVDERGRTDEATGLLEKALAIETAIGERPDSVARLRAKLETRPGERRRPPLGP